MLVKVCPRCGSDNIVWIIPQNWSMWECNDCDYTGAIIEVEEEVQKEIMNRWREHKDDEVELCADDDSDDISEEEFEEKLRELFDEK